MAELNEVASQIMEHLISCPKHGYTQGNRWGNSKTETLKIDGKDYTIAQGDRDCSSAIISAYKSAGLNVNATYTGNMKKGFIDTGLFEWKPMSFSAQRGDIYLNEVNHTAMCLHEYGSKQGDTLGEFSISENGTIYGVEGDQTGHESHSKPYYDYPWNGILHFTGGSVKAGEKAVKGNAGATKAQQGGKIEVQYRLFAKNSGWLPMVKDFNNKHVDGYAGARNTPNTAFEAKVSRGSIRYRVHTPNGRWCEWVKDGKTVGGEPWIDGIQLYYTTPAGESYKQAWYRASTVGNGYEKPCCDDGTVTSAYDGWAGVYGLPIDRLQVQITDANPF